MECYSAFKREGIVTHATAQMKLEDIVLSEVSQTQKNKYCSLFIYSRYFKQSDSQRQNVEWRLPGAGRMENEELSFIRCRVSVWEDGKGEGWW